MRLLWRAVATLRTPLLLAVVRLLPCLLLLRMLLLLLLRLPLLLLLLLVLLVLLLLLRRGLFGLALAARLVELMEAAPPLAHLHQNMRGVSM